MHEGENMEASQKLVAGFIVVFKNTKKYDEIPDKDDLMI